jgi:hypothetical protein
MSKREQEDGVLSMPGKVQAHSPKLEYSSLIAIASQILGI